jgi:hypothetical protein
MKIVGRLEKALFALKIRIDSVIQIITPESRR